MAEALRSIIQAVMRQGARQHRPLFTIQRQWTRLVGKELAGHTRPVSLHRGRLVVHVDQPGDSFALSYQKAQLLKRLQTNTKGRVEEIVIRAGELQRGEHAPPK